MGTLAIFYLILACALIISILVGPGLAIWMLAEHDATNKDAQGNPQQPIRPKFFTFMEEGSAAAITRSGRFKKFLMAYQGHRLEWVDHPGEGRTDQTLKVIEGDPESTFLEEYFGLFWMGWWPVVERYIYRLVWDEWSESREAGRDYEINHRTANTDYVLVQAFNYAASLNSAEADGNVAVNVKISFYIRVIYPYIALFENDGYLQRLSQYILREARLFVGSNTFNDLRKEARVHNESGTSDFSETIQSMNDRIRGEPGGAESLLGVHIEGAAILAVDIDDEADPTGEVIKATTAPYIAEQERLAREQEAEAEAYYRDTLGEDYARFVRGKEAIEQAGTGGNTVIFDGNDSRGNNDRGITKGDIVVASEVKKNRTDGGNK